MRTFQNNLWFILFTCLALPYIQAVDFDLFTHDGIPTAKLKKILDFFSIKETDPQKIVDITQEWCRPQGLERWQVSGDQLERHDEFIKLIEELELTMPVEPLEEEYDYLLVLGALAERMDLRIAHFVELLQSKKIKVHKIALLSGCRPLDQTKESKEFVSALLKTDFTDEAYATFNEGIIMHKLSEKYNLVQYAPIIEINVDMIIDPITGKKQRPITQDTIKAFLEKEKFDSTKKNKILVISNQPFIGYQHAVVKTYFPENCILETIGKKGTQNDRIYLDTLARWIYQENQCLKQCKNK